MMSFPRFHKLKIALKQSSWFESEIKIEWVIGGLKTLVKHLWLQKKGDIMSDVNEKPVKYRVWCTVYVIMSLVGQESAGISVGV